MRKLNLDELDVESFAVSAEADAGEGTVEGRALRDATLTHEGGYTCYPDSGCPNGCTNWTE